MKVEKDTELNFLECNRCGNVWLPSIENPSPRCCPRCRSAYWDTARIEHSKNWKRNNIK